MSLPQDFDGGFTVLMAVYARDDATLFARAVTSVFANTLPPAQFVLVVDGPVPEAIEAVIRPHEADGRIEVVRLARNVGLAHALNAGLERVTHAWVVRADADDANLPARFELQARATRDDPRLDIVGGAIREVDREGAPIAVRRTPSDHEAIVHQLPSRNPINHPAVAYRAEVARRVGGYPIVHLKEDYALWCLFAKAGARFRNLEDVLVLATAGRDMYRRRGGWRYIASEMEMQKLMVTLGLKPLSKALAHGLARSAVFALPGWARGLVYRRFLRSDN